MQWIPADKAPPSEYQSSAMDIVPLLLSLSDDVDHYPYAVKGRYVGGHLNSWFIEGSPSEVRPKFWMPCPRTAPADWTPGTSAKSSGRPTLRQQLQAIDSAITVARVELERQSTDDRATRDFLKKHLDEMMAVKDSLGLLADHMVLLHRLDRVKF